jgi:hypothetical protein
MDDNQIVSDAAVDGFELKERPVAGAWVWVWARGDGTPFPCFLERDQALRWMADRLRRVRVFA